MMAEQPDIRPHDAVSASRQPVVGRRDIVESPAFDAEGLDVVPRLLADDVRGHEIAVELFDS